MTQYNMKDLETAGLLKMDFLGLRTLTVIENALRLIRENHGVDDRSWTRIPEDDADDLRALQHAATRSASSSSKAPACRTGCGS